TAKRVAAVDFAVYFKEFPHTAFVDRAEDLWRMPVETLEGRIKPDMSVFDCKMIDVFPTSREPMRSCGDKIMQIETDDPDIRSSAVSHGFMV
ncbi:M81 family metallopeptidase, partial [Rhizobium ruizarguesonis]